MTYKTYIMTFLGQGIEIWRVNQLIQTSPYVISYWNYLPLVYCLKSKHSVAELRAHFDQVLQYQNFIIAEINPNAVDGRLSGEAWDWFREDPNQQAHSVPLSPPPRPPAPPPSPRPMQPSTQAIPTAEQLGWFGASARTPDPKKRS